nr:hypothetical protein CFP56_16862 [Quercus suber]
MLLVTRVSTRSSDVLRLLHVRHVRADVGAQATKMLYQCWADAQRRGHQSARNEADIKKGGDVEREGPVDDELDRRRAEGRQCFIGVVEFEKLDGPPAAV